MWRPLHQQPGVLVLKSHHFLGGCSERLGSLERLRALGLWSACAGGQQQRVGGLFRGQQVFLGDHGVGGLQLCFGDEFGVQELRVCGAAGYRLWRLSLVGCTRPAQLVCGQIELFDLQIA
jgi:hypothetical protein